MKYFVHELLRGLSEDSSYSTQASHLTLPIPTFSPAPLPRRTCLITRCCPRPFPRCLA